MAREPRFPGIEWYCDQCNANLSSQKGFDDHKYTWKCKECGYKNSISWDNVNSGDSGSVQFLLHLLGFISFTSFWTTIMLGVSLFALHADHDTYFIPFIIALGICITTFVIDLFIEFRLRHTTKSVKNIITIFLRNLKEDLLAPFLFIKEVLCNLFASLVRVFSGKKKAFWNSDKMIIISSIIYLIIFAAEIIIFNKINGIGASDWWNFLVNCINSVGKLFTGK